MSDLEKNQDTRSDMAQELTDEIEALERLAKTANVFKFAANLNTADYKHGYRWEVVSKIKGGPWDDLTEPEADLLSALGNNALPLIRRLHAALVVAEKEREELFQQGYAELEADALKVCLAQSIEEKDALTLSRDEALAELGKMREERDRWEATAQKLFAEQIDMIQQRDASQQALKEERAKAIEALTFARHALISLGRQDLADEARSLTQGEGGQT